MSLDTISTERRKTLRKRPPRLIYVDLSAANGGMVRDISEDGFAVRAMMPLTPGESAPFSFLLGESTRIEGEGEVVWVEDKGKVAGIRFTQMSAEMRKDIQNWLNDVTDVPETKEEQAANAQNFDQLREELRNAPPRGSASAAKANKSRWPIQSPESEPEGGFQEPSEQEPAEPHEEREWRGASHPIPFPGAAHSAAGHDNVEGKSEARLAPRDGFEKTLRPEPAPRRVSAPNPSRQLPPLPDISKILMQPPKKATSYGHQAPVLEPLDSAHMYESRQGGWFTASRAIMIMIALAAAVAIYAYRETVGEGLIWLGQQVSGPSIQRSTPPQDQGATSPETNSPAASSSVANPSAANPATAAPPPSSVTQPESKQDNGGNDNASDHEDTNPVASKPAHPSAPLPRPSSVGSDAVSETGSAEYSQAQQLLHVGDTSEAVRFLWIAVEKGNASAELTLAELYWHGRGVARNCDQTRILLGAAARKGNADAQRLLQLFQREGCE
jgi:PilZ domain